MKSMLKERLAVLLSVLLVLPAILGMFPAASVQAAAVNTAAKLVNSYTKEAPLIVEAGQKFYIGDCVTGVKDPLYADTSYPENICATRYKSTYTSSETKIATVDKNSGLVTTKKTGTTVIKIKNSKKTLSCYVQVVKKGSLGSTSTYKELNTAANKMDTTTTKSRISALKAYVKLLDDYNHNVYYYEKVTDYGFLRETHKLVVPMGCRLAYYYTEFNPLSTYSAVSIANVLLPQKAKADSRTEMITVTLKNPLTKDHILWINCFNTLCGNNKLEGLYRIEWIDNPMDPEAKSVYVTADFKANSKTFQVKFYNNYYGEKVINLRKGQKMIFHNDDEYLGLYKLKELTVQ